MKRKLLSLVLACALVLSLCGCGGTVGEIAGNVANAAMEELETQVRKVLEENKLEVVELKTAFGKLNDDGGDYQFFVAALVRTESQTAAQATADTLAKLFTDAGLTVQTASALESPYLVHKDITFKHSDFSGGNYYVIYAYHADLAAGMPSLS